MVSITDGGGKTGLQEHRLARFIHWMFRPLGSAVVGAILFFTPFIWQAAYRIVFHFYGVQVWWLDLPNEYGAVVSGTGVLIPIIAVLAEKLDRLRAHDEIVDIKSRNAVLEDRLRLWPLLTDDIGVLHVPLTVSNFNNFLAYVPLYIACELGLFGEERLHVNIVHNKDDLSAVRTLTERKASFAITDPTYCFDEKGERLDNVKIIAPFINRIALWAVSAPETNIQSDEMKIKCRTYGTNSTAAILATKWCQAHGAAPPSCVDSQPEELLSSYLERLLNLEGVTAAEAEKPNVLIVTEPEATWLTSKGFVAHGRLGHGKFTAAESLQTEYNKNANPTFAFAAIISRQDFILQHPHIIERFLRAMRFSYFYIHSLPDLPVRSAAETLDVHRQATISFLREPRAKNWKKLLTIVKNYIVHAYPNDFDHIPEEVIAIIIERFRKEGYYPTTVIPDEEFAEGFRRAYRARFNGWPEGTDALMSTIADSFLAI
jgi:hypothetical protein